MLQRFAAALLALALLMGTCAAAQAEDEIITAREMMALLDGFVADKGAERLAEWQAMFPAARESDAKLTRADGICMLYGAACTARPDKVELGDNCWTLHEKIGEKIWDEYAVNEALFGETVYEPSPWHEWNYSASAYFFALDVRDWDGEMLFDYDPEANTLHTDAPLTRADAKTAIARPTEQMVADRGLGYRAGDDGAAGSVCGGRRAGKAERVAGDVPGCAGKRRDADACGRRFCCVLRSLHSADGTVCNREKCGTDGGEDRRYLEWI